MRSPVLAMPPAGGSGMTSPTRAPKTRSPAALRARMHRIERRIEQVRAEAESRTARLTLQLEYLRAELARATPPPATPLATPTAKVASAALAHDGRSRPRVDATVDDLVAALAAAGGPLSAREVRRVLAIDDGVLVGHVTRFLSDAVRTGRVERTGNAGGTRYRLPKR
jgi:hypothetical protein